MPTSELILREFIAGDEIAFRRLNEEWILRYFTLEPKDREVLNHPQANILGPGGRIFLAVSNAETVGCCALLAMGPGEFEVAKMAVTESLRGSGIGRRLLEHVIREARAAGATRLYLETNWMLTPAIRLYRKMGFRALRPGRTVRSPYARSNLAMELYLDWPESLLAQSGGGVDS